MQSSLEPARRVLTGAPHGGPWNAILHLDTVPRHLIVIGGSYVGLEFAQIYRRFGSEVTVVEAGSRLIGREDPEISDAEHGILRAESIAVHVGARTVGVEQGGNGIAAIVEDAAGRHAMEGSHLLICYRPPALYR
jgi:pyruvate/2-oxoglutarate dehydrogenase complex dihydrolipoamide dehydrogenase (E3) component